MWRANLRAEKHAVRENEMLPRLRKVVLRNLPELHIWKSPRTELSHMHRVVTEDLQGYEGERGVDNLVFPQLKEISAF